MTSLFYLKIAGIVIKINCPRNLFLYDDWENLFTKKLEPFLVSRQKHKILVNFSGIKTKGLKTIPDTISSKISMPLIRRNNIVIDNLLHPSLFLYALSKTLVQVLKKEDKIILHSSGVIYKGSAILFVGNSGDGKSTAHNKLSPPLQSLGDDSVIVGLVDGAVLAYPTPLNSKVMGKYANNKGYLISKVYFLEKSDKLALKKKKRLDATASIANLFKHPIADTSIASLSLRISSTLSNRTYIISSSKKDLLMTLLL